MRERRYATRSAVVTVMALAMAVCLLSGAAWSADTGSISGKVTADKGKVVGFRVKARDAKAAMTYNVFTRDGTYRIPDLTPATYEVWVAQRGFESPRKSVTLGPGENAKLDLQVTVKPGFDVANQFRQRDSHTIVVRDGVELAEYDEIYPPGPGRDALQEHCMACHGTWFHHMRRDTNGWETAMTNMINRRSLPNHRKRNIIYTKENFPPEDARLITEYLIENFNVDVPYRDILLDELVPNEDIIADAVFIEYDVPPQPDFRPRSYHDPYISPTGEVWFNDRANRSLLQIDPDARDASKMVVQEHQAPWPDTSMHGIVIDSKGLVYYADVAGGWLGELDPETGEFTRYASSGYPDESMIQIVVDSKDNIWMGLISGNFLGKLDGETRKVTLWEWPTEDTNPYGLIVSDDDKVWTASISKSKIVRFDPETYEFTEFPTPQQPSAPRRLGEDNEGRIWWAEYSGGHVGMLDPKTGRTADYEYPLRFSRGYDCWPVGDYIWSTEATYETLVRFDPETEEFVYYPLPLSQPSGNPGVPKMEVGHDGTIWFAYRGLRSQANPVVAFKPQGNAR